MRTIHRTFVFCCFNDYGIFGTQPPCICIFPTFRPNFKHPSTNARKVWPLTHTVRPNWCWTVTAPYQHSFDSHLIAVHAFIIPQQLYWSKSICHQDILCSLGYPMVKPKRGWWCIPQRTSIASPRIDLFHSLVFFPSIRLRVHIFMLSGCSFFRTSLCLVFSCADLFLLDEGVSLSVHILPFDWISYSSRIFHFPFLKENFLLQSLLLFESGNGMDVLALHLFPRSFQMYSPSLTSY